MQQLGRGLIFLLGALVGGLALAFVIVYLRPELLPSIRSRAAPLDGAATAPGGVSAASAPEPAASPPASTPLAAPEALAADAQSFAMAVSRAAPAVVKVYTQR